MASLNDNVKLFVVRALACYDQPTEITRQVKEEFGLEVTRQQVAVYDPTRVAGKDLSKKWRVVFEAARKAFLEDVSTIPIASQSFRLRALNRMYEKVQGQGNVSLAAQLIEQAAKESGGAFTNKQKLDLSGNLSLTQNAQDMSDDELAAIATRSSAGVTGKA